MNCKEVGKTDPCYIERTNAIMLTLLFGRYPDAYKAKVAKLAKRGFNITCDSGRHYGDTFFVVYK